MDKITLSIVIPAYNEATRIGNTLDSIERYFAHNDMSFEVIVVDDGSKDGTAEVVERYASRIKNLKVLINEKNSGKGFSVKRGMLAATGDYRLFMDADNSVDIPHIAVFMRALSEGFDVAIGSIHITDTTDVSEHNGWHRRILGYGANILVQLLAVPGIEDTQRGFKLFSAKAANAIFPRQTIERFGFDIEVLVIARENGFKIKELPVVWDNPADSKVTLWSYIKTFQELILIVSNRLLGRYYVGRSNYLVETQSNKVKVFFQKINNYIKLGNSSYGEKERPIDFNNKKDFLFLPKVFSAKKHFYSETFVLLALLFLAGSSIISVVHLLWGISILVIISTVIVLFYLSFMVFKIWVIYYAITDSPIIDFSKKQISGIHDEDLPIYTIIIPLYREEDVIPQIIQAMSSIDYPTNKLDVIITLEEYDLPTINAIAEARPPSYFKTLILPNVNPKTKPKALNVAFSSAQGEFLVIYDAEIIPEPDQLKKAVLAFRSQPMIACFQTRLDHYNPRQSIITKLFNSEFSFHYDFFLPGLQRLGFPLPLSGHSTHFRTDVLRKIGAWDPFNVTEDCDAGIRLYRAGYSAGMINSSSKEEATAGIKSWILQRTRWMKGFIQTSIVHLRHPLQTKKEFGGWVPFIGFLFIVPGGVLINIINFFSWIVLLTWFMTHSTVINSFYPPPILYISVFCFIVGTFMFTFMNLLSAYRRQRYDLVKYNLLSFIYWILLAIATVRASVEFFTRPYHWEKTAHGTHLKAGWEFDFVFPLKKLKSFLLKYR